MLLQDKIKNTIEAHGTDSGAAAAAVARLLEVEGYGPGVRPVCADEQMIPKRYFSWLVRVVAFVVLFTLMGSHFLVTRFQQYDYLLSTESQMFAVKSLKEKWDMHPGDCLDMFAPSKWGNKSIESQADEYMADLVVGHRNLENLFFFMVTIWALTAAFLLSIVWLTYKRPTIQK